MRTDPRRARRPLAAAVIAALTAASIACDAPSPVQSEELVDPVLERILALGFPAEVIEDRGDYYLVEGDISFSKQELVPRRAADPQPTSPFRPQFHYRTTNLVSQSAVGSITVNVAPLASQAPAWAAALTDAIAAWNGIGGTAVHMTAQSGSGDITVGTECDDLFPNSAARAEFPWVDGSPGWVILVNRCSVHYSTLSHLQKVWVMAHELGHTVGLRHTNGYGEGSAGVGLIHIPGTPGPEGDPASVFNTGLLSVPAFSGFSNYDKIAIRTLYPPPPPPVRVHLDGPFLVTVKALYTYTANVSDPSFVIYDWYERFCTRYDDESSCTPWTHFSGLGATFTRVLGPDCSGVQENNFQVRVRVRRPTDGSEDEDTLVTGLCKLSGPIS